MLAFFCGLSQWRKPENPEKTTDLGWAITTLPQADAENQTHAAAVTSERHTSALSRPHISSKYRGGQISLEFHAFGYDSFF